MIRINSTLGYTLASPYLQPNGAIGDPKGHVAIMGALLKLLRIRYGALLRNSCPPLLKIMTVV